jgi:ABC-2 type transport system permease protein
MLIFSNIITSLSTIFLASDVEFLLSLPVKYGVAFLWKFLQTCFYASWSIFLTSLPFIIAYNNIKRAPLLIYPLIFVSLVFFFIIASFLGVLINLVLLKFFPNKKLRDIMLVIFVFAGVAIYVIFRFLEPERLLYPDKLYQITQYIMFLETPTAIYLPSWWVTAIINSFIAKNYSETTFYFIILSLITVFIIYILWLLGKYNFFDLWNSIYYCQSAGKKGNFSALKKYERYRNKAKSILFSLLRKDVKIFFRDTAQWTQLLFLVGLIAVYLFNIYKLPLDNLYLKNLIGYLNIGLCGFVISAVALRLLFPMMSLEGKKLWLLRAAPVRAEMLILEKFIFGVVPLAVLSSIISILSNIFLQTSQNIFILSSTIIIVHTFVIAFFAICMGTVYPKFDYKNIPAIETSPGGILFMIWSMFYVILTVALFAGPVHASFMQQLFKKQTEAKNFYIFSGLIFSIISVIIVIFSYKAAKKKFINYEEI